MKVQKVRVKVVGSGEPEDPFHVELPIYRMLPGSEEYDPKDKKILRRVEVLIPADECDEKGQLSKARIRAKYKGQPAWDREDVLEGVV